MRQYKVISKGYESDIYDTLQEAKTRYYNYRQLKMKNVPDEDTYVEIIYSEDGFEDCDTLLRCVAVVDEDAHTKFGSPRENRFDFDYWCKWEETEF